jgi:peptidoglycan/LPS O-acetylase OafA/YrhL
MLSRTRSYFENFNFAKNSIARLGSERGDNFLSLRIIAALFVIYGHSFAVTQPSGEMDIFLKYNWGRYSGEIAICIFFVVSGFMVTGSYLNRNNFLSFLKARLLRIVPAYALVIVVCTFCIGILVSSFDPFQYLTSAQTWSYLYKNLTFWSSLEWRLPGVFEGQTYSAVNGSIWTIPAEFRMYLVVGICGFLGLLTRPLVLGPLLGVAFILSVFDPTLFSKNVDAVRIGGYFCLGMIAQLYKSNIIIRSEILIVLGIICYFSRATSIYFYLLAIGIAYFCFWFAYKLPHIKIEKFGDPSYGIYLWGWPVQQLLVFSFPTISPITNAFFAMIISICLGYASWHLVEAYALSFKSAGKKK